MPTYAQLKKQIEQLSKKAEAALLAEKDAVLSKVRDAVTSFGLTVEEVFSTNPKKVAKNAKPTGAKRIQKGAGQAKYMDPKTGATWSGFGRAPAWIASAKDRTKFLVDPQPASTTQAKPDAVKAKAPATKKTAKAVVADAPAKTVRTAPAKKSAKAGSTAKGAAPAKKTASVAPKKAVSKPVPPAKKPASTKAKTKAAMAPAPVVAPVESSAT